MNATLHKLHNDWEVWEKIKKASQSTIEQLEEELNYELTKREKGNEANTERIEELEDELELEKDDLERTEGYINQIKKKIKEEEKIFTNN